jgi:hypothetical protein
MSTAMLNLRIREQLSRYLAGQMSLRRFATWLAPIALESFETSDPQTEDLVAEIELRLAEYTNGDWTEEDLRQLLRPITLTYVSSFSARPTVTLVSGTSSSSPPSSINYSATVVDISHAKVRAS